MNEMTAFRILVVEDEAKLLNHLSQTLNEERFSVFTCSSYRELENLLSLPVKRFDVIVLDRLLHGKDSAVLIKEIRAKISDTKIMILSALDSPAEKVNLLDLGADDYLAKPFDSGELVARIRVLLRRKSSFLQFGNLSLDFVARTLKVNGIEEQLTNKEFILLKTLLEIPGKIFSKTFLYEQVWEMSSDVESNVVEATVNKLRKRLKEAGATIMIKNARNLGYWVEE